MATSQPSGGKVALIIALILAGVLALSWALGWIAVPLGVTSAGNVREQWRFAYEYNSSLRASATQVCTARRAIATSASAEERTQRNSQAIATEQNYARIAAAYDARLENAFEARLVRPGDVPAHAPTLPESLLAIHCDAPS